MMSQLIMVVQLTVTLHIWDFTIPHSNPTVRTMVRHYAEKSTLQEDMVSITLSGTTMQ